MGMARLVAGAGAGALAAVMAAQVGPHLASQPLLLLCMPHDDLP